MDHKEELWLRGLCQGRAMRFRPSGCSMVPFIRHGDVVTIVQDKRCRLGDVVLVHLGDALLLHRIVINFSGRTVTKGDALSRLDPPVFLKDILGRAVRLERKGRSYSLESLRSRLLGLAFNLALFWLPGLASRFLFLRQCWRRGMLLSRSLR